jgi:5-hydroxyisourate hydrolase
VLDTTTGTPGVDIAVTLVCLSEDYDPRGRSGEVPNNQYTFSAVTNSDGRVATWTRTRPQDDEDLMTKVGSLVFVGSDGDQPVPRRRWKVTFDLEAYWERKGVRAPFFPVVDVLFVTGGGNSHDDHWHVPLLVGPYSYTTYRGS